VHFQAEISAPLSLAQWHIGIKIPVGTTSGHRTYNYLAVGAIAPM